jgi:hypothetical protein
MRHDIAATSLAFLAAFAFGTTAALAQPATTIEQFVASNNAAAGRP